VLTAYARSLLEATHSTLLLVRGLSAAPRRSAPVQTTRILLRNSPLPATGSSVSTVGLGAAVATIGEGSGVFQRPHHVTGETPRMAGLSRSADLQLPGPTDAPKARAFP
jgi:hypothetical protein